MHSAAGVEALLACFVSQWASQAKLTVWWLLGLYYVIGKSCDVWWPLGLSAIHAVGFSSMLVLEACCKMHAKSL
jgi:hypothetical protein